MVLYSGTAKDREMIRDHEFKYKAGSGSSQNRYARQAAQRAKFNVLLASYETVRRDKKVFQVGADTFVPAVVRLCLYQHTYAAGQIGIMLHAVFDCEKNS